ncbi:FAD-binding oxidoreductase [Saccharothrix sp. HUAS TT1]|uniref:FAD-binding oxidoreductase n=1 Tax=unclassified Saccharothrix TaxID=2593673 RepID=UPI00345B57AE
MHELKLPSGGSLIPPGAPEHEAEQVGFNLIVPAGRPAALVAAAGPDDVLEAVRHAADRGLPIGVQATGHGVALPFDGAVLISTRAMDQVRIDPVARTAVVRAGARWGEVVRRASEFGLAPLNGASPSVGVVSYLLGGGLGHLGRSYGYGADRVRSLEVVTPKGEALHVSPRHHPDLFWGLRGGKGNFGVVTSVQIELVVVPRLYGGALLLPGEAAGDVLRTWRDWTRGMPDRMQSGLAFMRFPDDPGLPEPMRGRFLAHLRLAFNGPAEEGERLVRPLREIRPPVLDLVRDMSYARVAEINMDPTRPGVYFERSARLRALDDAALDTLLGFVEEMADGVRPGIELRHLGGALGRHPEHPNALPFREAEYTLFTGMPVGPGEADEVHGHQQRLVDAMLPWRIGGPFLSFISARENTPEAMRSAYDHQTYQGLVRLKDAHDPENLLRLNHNIPPTGWTGGGSGEHRA